MAIKQKVPDWIIGLLVTSFFIFTSLTGILDFTDVIEKKAFDFRAKVSAPEERNPDIELVVISDDDLDELGRFPWPRNILAKGIENLSLAGAKVIALNIYFTEPEESAGLNALRQLKIYYENLGLNSKEEGLKFHEKLSDTLIELDNDKKLLDAIEKAGNVVLPIYFDVKSSGRDKEVPGFMKKHALKRFSQDYGLTSVIWMEKLKPLLPYFADAAKGIGHMNLFFDRDGYIRKQAHVLGYFRNTYIPSFPLAIVKEYKGLTNKDILVELGKGIDINATPSTTIRIPASETRMETLIRWNKGPNVAFHHTPFSQVYKNQVQTSLFRDKIVIIGATAPGIGDRFVTPVSGNLPGIEIIANSIANILNQDFFSRPMWVLLTEYSILIFFGIFLTFVLPILRAGTGAFFTAVLLLGYTAMGLYFFFNSNIWLKITTPSILLFIGYVLIVSKRFLTTEKHKEKVEADSIETNKMLGISFQQQGMLDLALQKFQSLPVEEKGVKELLYNLGLDFEKKRQFSKALATYQLIVGDKKDFRDLTDRIPKLKQAEATMIFGTVGAKHPGDIGATMFDTETKPTLGRYEIVGELGRGAMGVVYKGEDPKIHRTVAIKTVNLSQFDDEHLKEVKMRFFREAESAGLMTHPNIVTIYDCGEEHDLAYIAMEFMEGESLEVNTKPGNLLPIRETLHITAKVADALAYAHSKNIVHRDIKPANIMKITDSDDIKVTDFGIARITSSSETKTGIVLGTPSYMSPEQVSGKKVDGRSDIFSLGVLFYEMLTGQKPFSGGDITALMFKIAKEKHQSPRSINPKVPPVVEKIIDKALEKDIAKRYQSAEKMADHIRQVIAKIDEITLKRKNLRNE
ncbi:CHASE2 domain-containing serine/threonine-protein kinase [Thermodesulfobacteriota bacterium]